MFHSNLSKTFREQERSARPLIYTKLIDKEKLMDKLATYPPQQFSLNIYSESTTEFMRKCKTIFRKAIFLKWRNILNLFKIKN